jgi:intracellular sulfur oxidation DsrE/DsrF family protein
MTTRKSFLAAGAALAVSPGVASAAAAPAPKTSQSEPPIPKLNFDVSSFNTQLDREVPHKNLFTARKLDYGGVLDAVRNTLNAYGDIGVSTDQVASAAVFYHGASILIATDDHVWDTYVLPLSSAMKRFAPEIYNDIQTVANGKTKGNPLLKTPAPNGLHFYVCNNALDGFSRVIANDAKKHPADVYADLTAHFVPNTTVVPAGVWAIHAIQERKYTLLQTS